MFRRFLMATVAGNFRRTVATLASQFFDALSAETAAGNTNVFYNPADLTSLRVGTDGSGGNPAVGDPVGVMLDTSQFGGTTAEAYLAGATELVTDGWTLPTGVTQDGNTFTFSNVALSDRATATGIVTSGEWYKIVVTWSGVTTGGVRIDAEEFNSTGISTTGASGTAEVIWNVVSGNGKVAIRATTANTTGTFNVSIKELPGHHAIAPSDSARPVLFDDPDLTAAALTDNGQRGPELVTNGTFDSDSDWVPPAGASISNGTAILENVSTGQQVYQSYALPAGVYEYTFDLVSITSGAIQPYIHGAGVAGTVRASAGTYTELLVVPTAGSRIAFRSNGTTSAVVDNISVRKVLTAFDERGAELWNTPTNTDEATWDSSTGTLTSNGNTGSLGRGDAVTAGATYEVQFTIESGGSGLFQIRAGNTFINTLSAGADGLYKYTVVAGDPTGLTFTATTSGVKIISSISVKQVIYPDLVTNGTFDTDSDWTKGTGWSIGSGVASASSATGNLQQTGVATANKWYKIQFYISAYTSGTITPNIGGTSGASYNSTGWKSDILRANGTPVNFIASSFTGSIDNVSVQELPASIDRKYYLDTDGSDDWMEVKPTLNLGEQWWHVGAWQSDVNGKYAFGTTASFRGGLRHASGLWKWRNAADTGLETLINFDPTTLHVLTVEQAGTNSISGRANGANSAGVITPYDDSGDTQGLALFSQENDSFNSGIDGRFYGGSWGQEALDSDQREITEAYIASLSGVTLP